LPLDLLVYTAGSLAVTRFVAIDEKNQYFRMIRDTWGEQLKQVFEGIADPVWNAAPETTANVLSSSNMQGKPVRVAIPAHVSRGGATVAPLQSLAQQFSDDKQH